MTTYSYNFSNVVALTKMIICYVLRHNYSVEESIDTRSYSTNPDYFNHMISTLPFVSKILHHADTIVALTLVPKLQRIGVFLYTGFLYQSVSASSNHSTCMKRMQINCPPNYSHLHSAALSKIDLLFDQYLPNNVAPGTSCLWSAFTQRC